MTHINAPQNASGAAAGVRIAELTDVSQHHEVAGLFRRVWRLDGERDLMEPNLIRAFAHAQNYVAGAYLGTELIGASIGFFGGDGQLHSHVTGVAAEHQDRGVGRALKWHQREWALARGVTAIRWTFDPLFRRNAFFNIHKLGALPTAYLPDFYGPMNDGVNAGTPSDRLLVSWELAAAGARPPAEAAGAEMLVDHDGRVPVLADIAELEELERAQRLLVALPDDIGALRADDPEAAERWRRAVRAGLSAALGAGYRIAAMTREGAYVLELVSTDPDL